jgi:spermidine synthase
MTGPQPIGRVVPIPVLLGLFVLSGAAGLIYEVVWARQLVLVFGNTSQAVSAILTGFFAGLAVGGALGGRLADRVVRPLRLYGALEVVLVVVVLLTPVSFRLVGEVYRGAYDSLAGDPMTLALVRFVLAIGALAPATILMGATLPTLTRFLAVRRGLAGAFTRLYAANTVGAIAGTAVAGFVLIELLGIQGALFAGAACSAAAGAIAIGLDRWLGPDGALAASSAPAQAKAAIGARRTTWRFALVLAFLSGLTTLGYQVVWNRLLGAGTGSSTYVFTIILTLFLTGIAIGAARFERLRARSHSVVGLIIVAQLATAVFVVVGATVILVIPPALITGDATVFVPTLGRFALIATLVVLPPTIMLGITFPATSALIGGEAGHEGAASGSLLAVNTAGAITASFLIPFFVIPAVGSPATLAALALANVAIALGLAIRGRGVTERFRGGAILAGSVLGVILAVALLTRAPFVDPTAGRIAIVGGDVFESTEDEIASAVAGQVSVFPQLWVAGTSMTHVTVDTKLMPLLPLMLDSDADRGLVIAFGMGTSFRTALRAGVETDAVELVPSVPGLFRWFYEDADAVLADPRGRVIVADGRNHVELTDRVYDFVIVDPPPPLESSGVSVISSLEFYRAAKARLEKDGVMVQWVPYGQAVEEFLAHVRTFAVVFPNVSVIAGPGGNGLFMIGSDGPVELEAAGIRSVLERPGILEDVDSAFDSRERSIDDWVATVEEMTWASGDELRAIVGEGALITDDRPLPEYFMLRRLAEPRRPEVTLDALRALRP